jgi:hypothetical protein
MASLCASSTGLALGLEAGALTLLAATSAAAGRKVAGVLLTGLGITLIVAANLSVHPGRRVFYGCALRLHRCAIAYAFAPAAALAAASDPSGLPWLCWALLASTGVANVSILSLVLQPRSAWLAAVQQAGPALLLMRRGPAICAALASHPQVAHRLLQWAPATMQLLSTPWAAGRACQAAFGSLVLAFVFVLPVSVAWLRHE